MSGDKSKKQIQTASRRGGCSGPPRGGAPASPLVASGGAPGVDPEAGRGFVSRLRGSTAQLSHQPCLAGGWAGGCWENTAYPHGDLCVRLQKAQNSPT